MLSRLVVTFLPRSKRLLISWLQSPSAVILEPRKIKSDTVSPIYLPWSDGTGCHEIKRCLLLGRKVMTNIEHLLESRDVTLPKKVHLVKAMVFPVVMYRCESWTIRKAEHRIDAFELWCWRRHLRIPWIARTSNQSILKEINPEYSLEGLMLKLHNACVF